MTESKAYVPKKGDIVNVGLLVSTHLVSEIDFEWLRIEDKVKRVGLSFDRIQAEYVSRERIQKRIDELKEQKNSYSVEMKCLASTTEQYKNLLTNFWILTGEIKELESLLPSAEDSAEKEVDGK